MTPTDFNESNKDLESGISALLVPYAALLPMAAGSGITLETALLGP